MRLSTFFTLLLFSITSKAQTFYLFAGTYTNKGSKGIYVYRFNAATGDSKLVSNTDSAANPSYLAIAPDGKTVYAITETGGATPGGVSAYSFNKKSGTLQFINQQVSGGDHPCYVAVNKKRTWLTVGNYSGGNLSVLGINKDGSLQPAAQTIAHSGSGPKPQQTKAHVHGTFFSPDEQYLFVPDLGIDQVVSYRFNENSATPLDSFSAAVSIPGSGPRHLSFHPNKKYAYVIEELGGTVAAYSYKNGTLSFLQRISSHPADYNGAIGSADIHLSPDGKFLYATNRGDANSIATFSVAANGTLTLKNIQSTMGKHPRNFTIDPTGNYLLVANRDSDNVVIFKRNRTTGLLQFTGKTIQLSQPVFLAVMK